MTRFIRRHATLTINRPRLSRAAILTRLVAALGLIGLAAWALFHP